MRIKFLAFAMARDLFGAAELSIELESGATIAELKQQLLDRFPESVELIHRSTFAVNQQYATDDLPLDESMEVAIIPPVSGG